MKITLEQWASRHYSKPPAIATLRHWAKGGLIQPAPVKVGRQWFVEPDAEYTRQQQIANIDSPIVERLVNGA